MCACVCVRLCVCGCVRACARECVCCTDLQLKSGHGILNIRRDLSVCCTQECETGLTRLHRGTAVDSAMGNLEKPRKKRRKKFHHTASSANRTHASCYRRITVQRGRPPGPRPLSVQFLNVPGKHQVVFTENKRGPNLHLASYAYVTV